ncbi:MAG: transposase-like protein, partial [Gammaproteobacteria bacterium]
MINWISVMNTLLTEPTKHKRRRYSAEFKAMVANDSNEQELSIAKRANLCG